MVAVSYIFAISYNFGCRGGQEERQEEREDFVTTGLDGTMRFWNCEQRCQTRCRVFGLEGRAIHMSPDGSLVAVGHSNGQFSVWETKRLQCIYLNSHTKAHIDCLRSAACACQVLAQVLALKLLSSRSALKPLLCSQGFARARLAQQRSHAETTPFDRFSLDNLSLAVVSERREIRTYDCTRYAVRAPRGQVRKTRCCTRCCSFLSPLPWIPQPSPLVLPSPDLSPRPSFFIAGGRILWRRTDKGARKGVAQAPLRLHARPQGQRQY